MRDYIELGTAPVDEDCVQVLSNVDYLEPMRKECKRFVTLLERLFPNMPENCAFGIKRFEHDFGGYYDVVCYYDDEDVKSSDYAINIVNNLPNRWDDN